MVNGVSTLPVPNRATDVQDNAPSVDVARVVAPLGFVVGDENRLIAAVLDQWRGVLDNRDEPLGSAAWKQLTSPLVLVGSTGFGKSHLAAGLAELAGDRRALCITANDLRREFADAIQAGNAVAWRERLVAVPVLVLDDLDHLPTRGSFQQELLHIVDESRARGNKLVVTSAHPIAHLPSWLPDLVNWFASGLTLEIAPLGRAARTRLIEQLAETNGWQFSTAALDVLVEHASPEPRELFRLAADVQRQFGRGARFEADTLTHFLNKRKSAQAPEIRDIVRVVSRYYRLPLKTLTSASRKADVVGARATAIYLARALTDISYEQIGQQLGGRDHTTIMHSHRQTTKRLRRETALRSAIEELTRLLRK